MELGNYYWNHNRTPEALALFREAYFGYIRQLQSQGESQ